jgi:hypothetical protein
MTTNRCRKENDMGRYEPNDSRKVTQGQQQGAGSARQGTWQQEEAAEPHEAYEPGDSRQVTQGAEPTGDNPVRQHNNAQEVTGGDLPDPHRAAGFDQDEG